MDLVGEAPVRPPGPAPAAGTMVDDDDPWATGPRVAELGEAVRDTLPGVADGDVPAVAARWARADELHGADGEDLQPVVELLVGPARRARADGDSLYCWACLWARLRQVVRPPVVGPGKLFADGRGFPGPGLRGR